MIGSVTHASRHANGTIRRINERKIDLTGPPQMGLRPIPRLSRSRGPLPPLRPPALRAAQRVPSVVERRRRAVRALSIMLGADYSSDRRSNGFGKRGDVRRDAKPGAHTYQEAVTCG